MMCGPQTINEETTVAVTGRELAGNWPGSGGLVGVEASGRSRRAARRASGSALILSIVTIVMLVMLGAAYLQVARTDRRTASDVDTRSNQDDGSILRYIGSILAGDIPEGYDGNGPEPYDVAWSNDATPWTVPDLYAPTVVPGPVPNLGNGDQPAREPRANAALADAAGLFQARGGELDDPYLAAIEPTFTGASPFWSHITNLSGVFLDLGNIAAGNDTVPGGTRPMPAQYLATAAGTSGWTPTANQQRSDVAFTVPAIPMALIPLAERGLFADADRDNIADSRWTWAPLPYEGGQAAVMAVRIVDNSALLNVNALAYDRFNAPDAPRWLWPGELDLHTGIEGIVNRSTGGSLTANPILTNAAPTGRFLDNTLDFAARLDNWLYTTNNNRAGWNEIGSKIEQDGTVDGVESPTDPTNTYSSYGARQEEIEFRYRNGLNNDAIITSFESLDSAPGGLFRSDQTETVYSDSTYGGPSGTNGDMEPYFLNEPRKWFTTVSGSAAFGQENLNNATTQELSDTLDTGPLTSLLFTYGGWTDNVEYTNQLACILTDFRDEDSELTELNGMYGMEYLPFVSEVYLQSRYDNTALVDSAVSASGDDEVTWTIANTIASTGPGRSPTTDAFAVAIEIVNPWPWTIEIPDVEVRVLDDGGNTRSWGTLETLINDPGKTTMEANEVIIFTRDDNAGADNTQIAAIAANEALGSTPPVFHYDVPATAADEWPVGNGAAGVVLAAQTSVGTRIGYQEYLVEEIAEEYREHYTAGAGVTVPPAGYAQITAQGTGDGLSVLTVRDVDVDRTEYEPNNSIPGGDRRVQHTAPQPVAGTAEFSVLVKGATSPDRGDTLDDRIDDYFAVGAAVDAGDEPWVIGNAGRFYRTGDLLRAVMIGPREIGGLAVPVAEVWERFRANKEADTGNPRHAIRDAMLSFNDTAVVGTGDDQNIPHAAYYLALFNTIDVNDGDGGLIDGRPNINTMPARLLADILPTLDPTYADTIAAQIVAAREFPNDAAFPGGVGVGRDPGVAGLQGIAYPGQLGYLPSVYDGSATPAGELIDFNEYEPNITHAFNPAPGAAALADSHSVDTEEQTMMLNYLNQVVSTRSDVFTAYVRVRLYPANDFSANGDNDGDGVFDPTNEYFLVAVFDRSSVTGQGLPRILSVKRYDVE